MCAAAWTLNVGLVIYKMTIMINVTMVSSLSAECQGSKSSGMGVALHWPPHQSWLCAKTNLWQQLKIKCHPKSKQNRANLLESTKAGMSYNIHTQTQLTSMSTMEHLHQASYNQSFGTFSALTDIVEL
jgi:hypothetical protein